MDFTTMTTFELKNYVNSFKWLRSIKQLHVHHTWKPDHKDYTGTNGIDLQTAMRNYHVNTNGWQDIAQHLTLLPDGRWITGRDFNTNPASISGWNDGAFCIEMLGNFDIGCDKLENNQEKSMLEFCAFFSIKMKLDIKNDIKFHRDSPTAFKTCPGSGINRNWFMNELNKKIEELSSAPSQDEAWKLKALDELASAGFINDHAGWKKKINEPMPVWAALAILNNIYKDLNTKKANKILPWSK